MNEFIYLHDIAHGRSGDKGDTSNICVYPRNDADYDFLKDYLTVDVIKNHFGDMVKGTVTRYEVDSLKGMNFVMHHALGGGATLSLRQDALGKCMGPALMRLKINKDVYNSYKK